MAPASQHRVTKQAKQKTPKGKGSPWDKFLKKFAKTSVTTPLPDGSPPLADGSPTNGQTPPFHSPNGHQPQFFPPNGLQQQQFYSPNGCSCPHQHTPGRQTPNHVAPKHSTLPTPRSNAPNPQREFRRHDEYDDDITGVQHSTPQRGFLPVAPNGGGGPVPDFSLVNAQCNGSGSLGTSDTISVDSGHAFARPQPGGDHEQRRLSRTSSINGNIHCDTSAQGHNQSFAGPFFASKRNLQAAMHALPQAGAEDRPAASREKLTERLAQTAAAHSDSCFEVAKLKAQLETAQQKNDAFEKENVELKARKDELEAKQTELETKGAKLEKENDRLALANGNMQKQIRKLEEDLSAQELTSVRLRSANNSLLNTPTIENLNESLRMLGEHVGGEFADLSNGFHRPRSLYVPANTPKRLFPAKAHADPRHLSSVPPLPVSRSTSTTPDSGAVMPLSATPALLEHAKKIQGLLFHLERIAAATLDDAKEVANGKIPKLRSNCGLQEYAILLLNMEQTQGQDLELFLEQTLQQLGNLDTLIFDLKQMILEHRKAHWDDKCEIQ
ncbi:hypothetical protein M3Y99_01733800 [Aphelenchoides fujianensis]|nr:hypothetical protein M3Y99_01733800 [Aphelenchoides fujianensis]